MSKKFFGEKRAMMLISDEKLRRLAKRELENCGFETEEFLCMIQMCQVVILDYFYFQFGITDYLKEKEIRKPVYLLLNQNQVHSGNIHPAGLVRDILVVYDHEEWETPTMVSALNGEVTFQTVFDHDSSRQDTLALRRKRSRSAAPRPVLLRHENWI